MRIGILSNTNYIDAPIGGTLTFLKNYLKYTSINYLLFGPSVHPQCERRFVNIDSKKYEFHPIYCAHNREINRMKGAFHTFKNINRIDNEVDTLYIHHPEMGYVISHFTNINYIYHMHGASYDTSYSKHKFMRNKFFTHLFKTMVLSSTKNAKAVIGVTKECKELVPSSVPFYYVPISVDTEIFYPLDENRKRELREKLNIPQDALIWLYVGRLGKAKNIPFIVDLFYHFMKKYISDSFLVIVGDGEERGTIISKIKNLKIENKVLLTGAVPHEATPQYYQLADIFIMASHIEGMPNSILEAMASGLLVVAPAVGGIPELLSTAGVIFNEFDRDNLLLLLKKELSRSDFLRNNALKKIQKEYSSAHVTYQIDHLIKIHLKNKGC